MGEEPEEVIEERVKEGIVQETEIYKYLEMVINKSWNLKDHILELNKKFEVINREISSVGAKHQVGKEEIRVKLKLYDTCLMPALLYGLEAWGGIDENEMNEIEKIQGWALIKTSTLPANQRIQYSIIMLYHDIMNSNHKRVAKKYYRSSHRVFCREGVPRSFSKFLGKHLCQSLFLIKLQVWVL